MNKLGEREIKRLGTCFFPPLLNNEDVRESEFLLACLNQ